ncbi:MAG TPA: hypothetical protein VGK16_01720 [Candidatus Limnocylindrales bacterium]|jgi:hypothetical protein
MAEHQATQDRSTRLAGIGGWLIVAGCVLVLITVALAVIGQAVTIGSSGAGSIVLSLAFGALAAGFALLALTGPRSIGGTGVRVGLGLLAVGVGGILVSSVVAGGMASDPLGEWGFVVPFLAGGFMTLLGVPVTVVGLLLHAGQPRRIAAAFVGGLAVVVGAGMLSSALLANDPGASSAPVIAVVIASLGLGLMLLSVGALGVSAIREAQGQGRAAA